MIDMADLAGTAMWAGLAVAYLLYLRSSPKMMGRRRAGIEGQSCARCGVALALASTEGAALMCGACVRSLRRTYRATSWLAGGLAALFAIPAPFIVVSEYRKFGPGTAFQDLLLLAVMVGLTGSVAWHFRRAQRGLK